MAAVHAAGGRIAGVLALWLLATAATAQVQPIPERKVDISPGSLKPPQPGQLQLPPRGTPVPIAMPTPPRVAVTRQRDAATNQAALYQGRPLQLEVSFANLPSGNVRVFADPGRHAPGSVSVTEDREGRYASSNTIHYVGLDGTLSLTVYATFALGQPLPPAGSPLHLRVRYEADRHPALTLTTSPLRVTGMKVHTVALPANIRELVDLGGWLYGTGARDSLHHCSGPAFAFSRPDVGVFVDGGKLRIRTRSGPTGATCPRETHHKVTMRVPWRVVAVNFSSSSSATDRCWVQSPLRAMYLEGERREGAIPMIPGRVALGWGPDGVDALPRMVGVTQCTNTLFDDHFVELRWDNVELLGPVDGNPAHAWPHQGFPF